MVEGCPMLETRPSSRLWKPAEEELWTEPMRWRLDMNRLEGERSRVLRSSRVLVRGRLLSELRAWRLLSLLLARAGWAMVL